MKTREQFITEHRKLFWHIPKENLNQISDEVLVEFIVNYGSIGSIKELINLFGINKLNQIYLKLKGRKKGNYFPEMFNFFGLLLKGYAQRNS